MTIELPDIEATAHLSAAEARLELACALYARGRVGKASGAELAGVDFFAFQRALGDRGISATTEQALDHELTALHSLFPR